MTRGQWTFVPWTCTLFRFGKRFSVIYILSSMFSGKRRIRSSGKLRSMSVRRVWRCLLRWRVLRTLHPRVRTSAKGTNSLANFLWERCWNRFTCSAVSYNVTFLFAVTTNFQIFVAFTHLMTDFMAKITDKGLTVNRI